MTGLTALVLAGSRPGGDPLAAHAGVSHKALIEIGGRTMIERVVGALAEVEDVKRIAIAIDRPDVLAGLSGLRPPACLKPVTTIAPREGPSASVAAALAQEGLPLLVTTADHALLQGAWLREFLGKTRDADVHVALARREAVEAAAPGTRRTYLRFSDGDFSGCNLFLLRGPGAASAVEFWKKLESERKRPLRMLRRLGFGYALRYTLRWLSLAQAIARLGALSQTRVEVVELSDGRAAIDVDKAEDLHLASRLLAGQ